MCFMLFSLCEVVRRGWTREGVDDMGWSGVEWSAQMLGCSDITIHTTLWPYRIVSPGPKNANVGLLYFFGGGVVQVL